MQADVVQSPYKLAACLLRSHRIKHHILAWATQQEQVALLPAHRTG